STTSSPSQCALPSLRSRLARPAPEKPTMSLYTLATGTLIGDPAHRTSARGNDFATATLRVSTDNEPILISIVAFGDVAAELLRHRQGDALAVAGRAKLTAWIGRDEAQHHGISIVADQIASAATARRADAERRRERRDVA